MKKLFLLTVFNVVGSALIFAQSPDSVVPEPIKEIKLNTDYSTKPVTNKLANPKLNLSCDSLVMLDIDKMTGDKTLASRKQLNVIKDQSGFQIMLVAPDNKILALSLGIVGKSIGCIDRGSKINILFRDGSKVETSNQTEFNCGARATVYFGGVFSNIDLFNQLKSKEIEAVRVWGLSGYEQQDFTSNQSKEFLGTVQCIAKSMTF